MIPERRCPPRTPARALRSGDPPGRGRHRQRQPPSVLSVRAAEHFAESFLTPIRPQGIIHGLHSLVTRLFPLLVVRVVFGGVLRAEDGTLQVEAKRPRARVGGRVVENG